uniref:EF-hand domain-containing protein n=1 Tax=Rhizophora mucronata TaxID=61149 RepID=A0A2P2PBD2_RHIMU
MQWAGFEASDEDIKAMIRLTGDDNDKDGVSYDDLIKILALEF